MKKYPSDTTQNINPMKIEYLTHTPPHFIPQNFRNGNNVVNCSDYGNSNFNGNGNYQGVPAVAERSVSEKENGTIRSLHSADLNDSNNDQNISGLKPNSYDTSIINNLNSTTIMNDENMSVIINVIEGKGMTNLLIPISQDNQNQIQNSSSQQNSPSKIKFTYPQRAKPRDLGSHSWNPLRELNQQNVESRPKDPMFMDPGPNPVSLSQQKKDSVYVANSSSDANALRDEAGNLKLLPRPQNVRRVSDRAHIV